MNIRESIDLGDGHKIEIGESSWDRNETSIRNRYPTADGRFNPHASSEIPLYDIEPLVSALASRDLLDVAATASLVEVLVASLVRRANAPASPSLHGILAQITADSLHTEVDHGPAVGNEAW